MQRTARTIRMDDNGFPAKLINIHAPPKQLYALGGDLHELCTLPCVAIVGSRKVTVYGRAATEMFATELARAGVVVISGLAIGVDGIAHRAALEAHGRCIAVLPCGLDTIYPAAHRQLAERILQNGGVLVSEYAPGALAFRSNFIARNRIVSGLSDAVLIPEAALPSGTLHTARFALEQGKELLAVPGNITSEMSAGTNNLIKTGAATATSPADVLHALGIEAIPNERAAPKGATPEEQLILGFLGSGICDGGELLAATGLTADAFGHHLTMLEISGAVRALGANQWRLA